MPRNASGTYTLPSGNPVVSGTLIDSSWANNTLNDMANEMTDSLSRSGEGGMLAPFRITDGLQATPSLAFTNEPSTGFYRAGTNEMWAVVGGTQITQFTATGMLGRFAAGAVTTPSVSAFGDTNTGIYFPGADQVAITTAGSQKLFVGTSLVINEDGLDFDTRIEGDTDANLFFADASTDRIGIGTSSPGTKLDVAGDISLSNEVYLDNGKYIRFKRSSGGLSIQTLGIESGTDDVRLLTTGSLKVVNGSLSTLMLLDSSGNLGLGVTPSAWTYFKPLQAVRSGFLGSAGQTGVSYNAYYDGAWKYIANDYALWYSQNATSGQHIWNIAASGTAGNAITFTQAMTLDVSGNLGVGTSSPSNRLTVSGANTAARGQLSVVGASASPRITLYEDSTFYAAFAASGTDAYIGTESNTPFRFITNGGEKARITSGGDWLVNTTSSLGKFTVAQDLGGVGDSMGIRDTGSSYGSGAVYISFRNNADSVAGKIEHTASTTVNYNTSSDERLKEDIGVATDPSVVDQIVIHDFKWKEDGRIDRGVFAQEAHQVKPSAISVGTDEVNDNGVLLNPWGVDYSKFVPDLIVHAQQLKKQVQEQQAMIEELKAKVAALEAK